MDLRPIDYIMSAILSYTDACLHYNKMSARRAAMDRQLTEVLHRYVGSEVSAEYAAELSGLSEDVVRHRIALADAFGD